MPKFFAPQELLKDSSYINGTNKCAYFTSVNQRNVFTISYRTSGQNYFYYIYTDEQYVFRKHCVSSSNVQTCSNGWSNFELTNNVYYRKDIDSILVIFIILLIICFYFPYRIIARLFGRWFKW